MKTVVELLAMNTYPEAKLVALAAMTRGLKTLDQVEAANLCNMTTSEAAQGIRTLMAKGVSVGKSATILELAPEWCLRLQTHQPSAPDAPEAVHVEAIEPVQPGPGISRKGRKA